MRKVLFLFITLILIIGGAYLIYDGIYLKRSGASAAVLSVNTPYSDAGVFLGEEYAGPTPFFKDDLVPGEQSLRVGDWVNTVTLTAGALTAVNQDLGPGNFTGGDVIWLEEASNETSLVVISSPDGASVSIDGQQRGEAPVRLSEIEAGEHRLTISQEGYVERDVRIRIQEGYKLNVQSTLMRNPLPSDVAAIEVSPESLTLYNFTSTIEPLTSDIDAWIKGLVFYFKSYGFDSAFKPEYYLTDGGNIYSSTGELLAVEEYPKVGEIPVTLGYVGTVNETSLTESAQTTLASLVEEGTSVQVGGEPVTQIEILETGTGWLRVRSLPGLSGEEIARVNVGETYVYTEEQSGWVKISVSDDQEGWVAGQFTKKL